jgi:ApaG protein
VTQCERYNEQYKQGLQVSIQLTGDAGGVGGSSMSSAETQPGAMDSGVDIKVSTQYLKQQSDPGRAAYAFAYTITITNNRPQAVKLLSRHWIITDQNNKVEEVKGSGVIGQQPLIRPGESYQYSSGAVIHTEIGDMKGTYTMQTSDGELFAAPIPLFILAVPHMLH